MKQCSEDLDQLMVHAFANKLVLRGITKLDMYLWRKTGRDTVVTNAIWKLQRKYMSRSKREIKNCDYLNS